MCDSSLTVLKFGGSVLTREQDLAGAAHEIYRWVRRGQRVVAVRRWSRVSSQSSSSRCQRRPR